MKPKVDVRLCKREKYSIGRVFAAVPAALWSRTLFFLRWCWLRDYETELLSDEVTNVVGD